MSDSAVGARPLRDRRWLLVTDVDGTLFGDAEGFAAFAAATPPDGALAVVLSSSRPLASLSNTMAQRAGAWQPTGIIGAMGTEAEISGTPVPDWQNAFAGFDRRPIDAVMASLGCEQHPGEYQTRWKASFVVPDRLGDVARRLIVDTGVPAKVVTSGRTDFDVIPAGAGKGAALVRVGAHLGIPPERTIAAGDSGNDADMLVLGRAIVVANATSDLRRELHGSGAYFARSAHAAGVLEGLRHFGALSGEEAA